MPEIERKTGLSRSSIYRHPILRGLLFQIGQHAVGALDTDIDKHIKRQAKGATARQAREAK
jgi:predicted DNA-binding transcriptional regulator AlpA